MKLIKLTDDHYVIVDNSEIKEGDWVLYNNSYVATVLGFPTDGGGGLKIQVVGDNAKIKTDFSSCKKITHSTQPLDVIILKKRDHSQSLGCYYGNGGQLYLLEVKKLIGGVDVEKKAQEYTLNEVKSKWEEIVRDAFKFGYNQALEDNKEKKYTEKDLKYMFECGRNYQNNAEITFKVAIEHMQPTTQWDVEFDSQGKLKLKK